MLRPLLLILLTAAPASATCGGATGLDLMSRPTSFGAGALIVPMDSCYNPDNTANSGPTDSAGSCGAGPDYGSPGGARCYNMSSLANVRHPFGIVYLLLQNGIPVSVILNNTKAGLADADFSVSAAGSAATVTLISADATGKYRSVAAATGVNCGTNAVYYGGMPFVVDAGYASQAVAVLSAFNAAHANELADVPLHIANYPFNAPVLGTLESRPKPVLIDSSPLDTYFDESGIPDTVAAGTTYIMMSSAGSYTWPTALGPNGMCTTCSTLSDAGGHNLVDVVWAANTSGILNNWAAIPAFFKQNGIVMAIDSGVAWESASGGTLGGSLESASKGAAQGPFCAAVAVKNSLSPTSNAGTAPEYPASNRFLQVADMDFGLKGNGGGADNTSLYDFQLPPAAGTEGLASSSGYGFVAGHPMVGGTQAPGSLLYLGSLNSWHGSSTGKDGGLRVMYNTLIAGGPGCGSSRALVAGELTRSTAVATFSASSAKVAEYLGSFDWLLPSPAAMGSALYVPDPSVYPYTTGHFREYKPAGGFTANASTDYRNCSAISALSACNWDAATRLPPFAARAVYVVTGSAGSFRLTAASTLTAGDATIKYLSTHLDKGGAGVLGGVDFGTPAVIEGLPSGLVTVAGAKTRPTIAYVGARDGMLHAFCVAGPSGGSQCYGKNPGEEIWAVIPPGAKKQLDGAYAAMDWSNVNVGGILRVADVQDTFGGNSGYRTVLLVGAHDGGYLDALDISDPNPANLNQPGFAFLWEQDGSGKADGTTQEPMGRSWGATFAMTQNGGAAIVASASTCRGFTSACPASVQNGMNVYVLRARDGLVVSTAQNSYSRKTPGFGTPLPNDLPATPTTLDADGDGFDETVLAPSLEGYVYRYTLKAGSAPNLASIDTSKNLMLFDASGSHCSDSSVACEPAGAPVSIVRNKQGPPLGAVVITGGIDWARSPAAAQTFHVYELDPTASATTAGYASRALPAMTPPVSSAPGAGAGVVGTAMSLRGFAQPIVSGSDLYADVTTLSVGLTSQVVQPLITPGTYGTVLRYSNVDSGSSIGAESWVIPQGAAFAGGAGSTFTFSGASGEELFAVDVSGAAGQSMQAIPVSSTPSQSFAINQSSGSGGRPFAVEAWFDGTN